MENNQFRLGLKLAIYIKSQFGSRQKEKDACLPKAYKLILFHQTQNYKQDFKYFAIFLC